MRSVAIIIRMRGNQWLRCDPRRCDHAQCPGRDRRRTGLGADRDEEAHLNKSRRQKRGAVRADSGAGEREDRGEDECIRLHAGQQAGGQKRGKTGHADHARAVHVRQLTVERTARISGDVEYENITIENGGHIDGRMRRIGATTVTITPLIGSDAPRAPLATTIEAVAS